VVAAQDQANHEEDPKGAAAAQDQAIHANQTEAVAVQHQAFHEQDQTDAVPAQSPEVREMDQTEDHSVVAVAGQPAGGEDHATQTCRSGVVARAEDQVDQLEGVAWTQCPVAVEAEHHQGQAQARRLGVSVTVAATARAVEVADRQAVVAEVAGQHAVEGVLLGQEVTGWAASTKSNT